jgi:hypothetical protein
MLSAIFQTTVREHSWSTDHSDIVYVIEMFEKCEKVKLFLSMMTHRDSGGIDPMFLNLEVEW